jgi:putative endonuclease
MINKIKTGLSGETAAREFLKDKGYEIIMSNYRYKKSEIDLIVKKDNWLVFVEVKTRSSAWFGFPEEFVDRAQQRTIFYGADQYVYETNWEGNVRYDIVSVMVKDGLVVEVYHIEDAFY